MTDPEWMLRGRCRGSADPDIFFPDNGGGTGSVKAKRICRPCPVRRECLEWQLQHTSSGSSDFGIWGGTIPAERERIRQWRENKETAA